MTDTNKLLELLLAAGDRGMHTSELRYLGVSGNPSQRRADLEARGYTITSTPEPYPRDPRRRGARYRLVGSPSASCPDVPSSSAGQSPAAQHPLLPQATSSAPRCALFDDWDEAA